MEQKNPTLKAGNFTGLASNYSQFRPNYSESVLSAILGTLNKSVSEIDFVDVGAGTGIWTRMVNARGVSSARAVEPNDDMREHGESDSTDTDIAWSKGSGEETGLASNSADLITMASSFHWVDFEAGLAEFHRILRPGGIFVALWNPRKIEVNPLLVEIENAVENFAPGVKRVSSGKSGLTDSLMQRLEGTSLFNDVMYFEGSHLAKQSIEHYLGVWWSVNDIRVQAGEKNFKEFMNFVEDKVKDLDYLETTYQTRAWVARKNS